MTRDPEAFTNIADAFDSDGVPNPWYYELVEPEFNWRANDIQCALGLSQLGKLGRFVARRRALAAAYDTKLAALAPIVRPVARTRRCLPALHLYAVLIDFEALGASRGRVMRRLAQHGVGIAGPLLSRSIASPIMRSATMQARCPAPISITRVR